MIYTLIDFEKAPGERFELSYPCEYALYGNNFQARALTRLGDPGTVRQINSSNGDYIIRYTGEKLFENINCNRFFYSLVFIVNCN